MMQRLAWLFVFIVVLGALPAAAADNHFLTLCYHNIEDENPDQSMDGVTTRKLVEQLSWLQSEGYKAISLTDLMAARDGRKPLPDKAVLLTFDDGYESFYTRAFPILEAFHFPAVLGVVDVWMAGHSDQNGHGGERVPYGDTVMAREAFVTWEQVREMEKTGLVEIVSHSHDLHHGVPANPQGNTEPAAITARYDAKTNAYESADAYRKRLAADAEASVQTILKHAGHKPRAMIWPYGAYNQTVVEIEKQHGMPVTFTLDDGLGSVDHLGAVPRYLVKDDPELADFAADIRNITNTNPMRVMQVDLDYIYDPDPAQQERNLGAVINRIYKMGISTVFLQAFADPDGTGLAKELYFPNRTLPVRADLFNRAVWQIKQRAHVRVYGWLPVLSYDFGPEAARVLAWDAGTHKAAPDANSYERISPFDETARAKILDIYEDMARQAPIDGLLFHDDALLSDFEDASAPAMAAYAKAGYPSSIEAIRADPALMKKWTAFKSDTLIRFTQDLAARVRMYRSPLWTARNIYAPVLLDPQSKEWFAQDYDRFLQVYDYTAVMAMPRMEEVPNDETDQWLKNLAAIAAKRPNGLKRTVFELQSVDWRKDADDKDRPIPTDILAAQMRLLARNGALNFGYYPDDFVTNTPDADELHRDFSVQSYPYLP